VVRPTALQVSRSFAAVIRQLPRGLCVETVVFYLVLRALDTIEDDMEAFDDPRVR
jgi:farnesyl-diphosphate farnesyltransferase